MPINRPLIEKVSPDSHRPSVFRGIVSPCTGCKNNVPVPTTVEEAEQYDRSPRRFAIPCPKQVLYAQKRAAEQNNDTQVANFTHPVYDERLRAINPVWPGLADYGNNYAYVFIATYEDNVETGWNPSFDTERIICRGPYIIAQPERYWNYNGRLQQGDETLILSRMSWLDGAKTHGYLWPAASWRGAQGYERAVDRNLGRSFAGNF